MSRKHAYIILTPLNPAFYIVKLFFCCDFCLFFYLLENIDCKIVRFQSKADVYSLESPNQGESNEYTQHTINF